LSLACSSWALQVWRDGDVPIEGHRKLGTATQAADPRGRLLSGHDWLLASWFTLLAAVTVPAAFMMGADSLADLELWGFAAIAGLAAWRLAIHVLDGVPRPLDLSVWVFVYVWMGLAPMAQQVTGTGPPLRSPAETRYSLIAVAIIILGLAAYVTAQGTARRRPVSTAQPSVIDLKRLTLLSLAAFPLAAIYLQSIGGVGVAFSTRQELTESVVSAGLISEASKSSGAIIGAVGSTPVFVAFLAWSVVLRRLPPQERPPFVWLMWAALAALMVVVNNPISNSRYWFGTILIALLFAVWPTLRAGYRGLVVVALFTAAVLFPYTDYFRYEPVYRQATSGSVLQVMSAKGDYDAQAQLTNTVDFVDSSGLFYGQQALGALLFWVPRSVWPDKPVDTGTILATYARSTNLNLSAPLWSEAYIDFGLAGVVLAFLALGYAVGRLDLSYATAARWTGAHWALIAAPVAAGYLFIILRGSLLQAMGRALALALCLLWLRRRVRGQNPTEGGQGREA
jgi:hypothetical protein